MGTSSGTPVNYGVDRTLGETITLLARYDFVDGAANDTGALFINPTNPFGIGNTAYIAATTTGTDALTISSVNLRQGTASSAPTVTIDNISVNTTAIPEPSSIALLGLMSCVGLTVRRRMK